MRAERIFNHMPKIHTTTARVLYAHTDCAGVVFHSRYLEFFEAGRASLMREVGMPYSEVEKRGVVLAVTECFLKFRRSARYDDLLQIRVWVSRLTAVRIGFDYEIARESDGELLTTGNTLLAGVTRDGKPIPIPDFMLEKMRPYLESVEGYTGK